MLPYSQDNPAPGQSAGTDRPSSAAAAYLVKASTALQKRLGRDIWGRLDKRTRSCLVTSQVFHEMLEEVAAERDKALERTGKKVGQIEAPEIDFSPVILCLFKAIEIEIERKIFKPFRESLGTTGREATHPEDSGPVEELASLANFVRHGKPSPNLKLSALLFSRLRQCQANDDSLLGELKRWMRAAFCRPNRLWRDERFCQRIQQSVDMHRNAAAHTGRLTPLEAQKAVAELWGNTSRPGLILSLLRNIESVPVPGARSDDMYEANRAEIRDGLFVERNLLLKSRFWLFEATDKEIGDRYLLTVVPGDFDSVKSAAAEFKARRQVTDEHLLPLENWFQAAPPWGNRIVIASPYDEANCILPMRKLSNGLGPIESEALALALTQATSALHNAGFVHGFVSPYTVFRTSKNHWLLGGQALQLIVKRGYPVYHYPRVLAPERKGADPGSLGPPDDVFGIAATVCCMCAGRAERNAGSLTPADAERLFPLGRLRTVLSRALSPNPSLRHADATELFAALSGHPMTRGHATEQPPCPVVISYSRKDDEEAEQLSADLDTFGIRVWRDKDRIPGGAQWRKAIVSAIQNCQVVIFLVSKHSMESEQVPKELDIAAETKKVILPVCLDDTKLKDQFLYLLAGVHRLEFFAGNRKTNLNQLLIAIRQHGVTPERNRL